MELERILQSQGFGSRKASRQLIRAGAVSLADGICEDPFVDLSPEGLVFYVDDEPWEYRASAYLMLNKPAGYETSRQPIHNPSVFSLLPEPLLQRGVQAVGRLDQDTTGLLLFSDDGQFIHRLSSPKKQIPKVYAVTTRHPVGPEMMQTLLDGVLLHDETAPIRAAACEQTGENQLRLTITGGKYHQVKRMVAAAGNRVEALCRQGIGQLQLPDDLAEGDWRWLTAEELQQAETSLTPAA